MRVNKLNKKKNNTQHGRRSWGFATRMLLSFAGILLIFFLASANIYGDLQTIAANHRLMQEETALQQTFDQIKDLVLRKYIAASDLMARGEETDYNTLLDLRDQQSEILASNNELLLAGVDLVLLEGLTTQIQRMDDFTDTMVVDPWKAGAFDRDKIKGITWQLKSDRENIIALLDNFITDSEARVNKAGQALESATAGAATDLITSIGAALLIAIVLGWLMIRSVRRPLKQLSDSFKRLAEGDLSLETVTVKTGDEIGALGQSFNTMLVAFREVLTAVDQSAKELSGSVKEFYDFSGQVRETSEQVASSVAEISQGSEELAHKAEEAFNTAGETDRKSASIGRGVEEVSTRAQEASQLAARGQTMVKDSSAEVETVAAKVEQFSTDLNEAVTQTHKIAGFVETITDIASQTNLLALNAAIEAARAGEHGRGFAVVAEEVRKLADESTRAAGEVSQLVAEIQKRFGQAQESTELSREAAVKAEQSMARTENAFQSISQAVETLTTATISIQSDVEALAAESSKLKEIAETVASISEETAASTEEVSASAQEQSASTAEINQNAAKMDQEAKKLLALLKKFKF